MKEKISNLVTLLFVIAVLAFGLYWGRIYVVEKRQIESNSEVTKAVVIESNRYVKRGTKENIITYKYSIKGEEFTYTTSGDLGLKVGDTCLIRYAIENPKNSELVNK